MSKESHLICTRPFEWFEATDQRTDHAVFLCCMGWLPVSVGKLTEETPTSIWKSNKAKMVRKSVLDGSFKFCNKEFCPHLNAISGPVKYVNKEELKKYQKMADEVDYYPTHLNCSYDRSCNLSCPSCRSNIVMAKGTERDSISTLGENLVDELGPKLETVYITGSGDPFASKHFLDILTQGKLKNFPQLKLNLHTNAQLLTEDVWSRLQLPEDKIDILEVSIDGASKITYEDNRRPGNWEVLLKNMEFISSKRKENKIRELKISFVVQANNYHEMQAFITLGKNWSVDLVNFGTLNNWGTFANKDYLLRAIHKESHPAHHLLLEQLKEIDVDDKQIELGYFKELLNRKNKTPFSIKATLKKLLNV